jgi:hypothetical protein
MSPQTRTPPPGVALERARPNGVALTSEERQYDALVRMANVYSMTSLVCKEMRNQPAVVMAGLLLCDGIGVDPRTFIGALDVIEGRLEPRAQMYLAAANVHGWETKWGFVMYPLICDNEHRTFERLTADQPSPCRCGADRWWSDGPPRVFSQEPTNERADLLIRPYGTADTAWECFSFTIAQARQAGLMDEWVERQVRDGQWEDSGKPKYRTEKFVLGRVGVTVPDWALEKVAAGETKHKDNWHNWTADMLAARASKRAVKRAAPSVMFGVLPKRYQHIQGAIDVRSYLPKDENDPGADAEARTALSTPVPAAGDLATDVERRSVRAVIARLTPSRAAELRRLAREAGVPNVDGDRFTHDDAVLLLDLADSLQPPDDPAPATTPDPEVKVPPVDDAEPVDAEIVRTPAAVSATDGDPLGLPFD